MHTTNQDLFNISYNSNNNKFCSLAMCFNKGVGLEFHRLVFSRFFDICGNLGNAKEKPTRKTFFSREMKRQTLRIYLAKLC